MKTRLLDPAFKYVPSHATNVRKTIKREQERLAAEKVKREAKVAGRIEPKARQA